MLVQNHFVDIWPLFLQEKQPSRRSVSCQLQPGQHSLPQRAALARHALFRAVERMHPQNEGQVQWERVLPQYRQGDALQTAISSSRAGLYMCRLLFPVPFNDFWQVYFFCVCISVQILLHLGDFAAARRSLKKAFCLGSQQPSDREAVKRDFKHGEITNICEWVWEIVSDQEIRRWFIS